VEIVRLEEITKTFPGVRALDKVSLDACGGEIMALVGENGAGKSTLMKVLSGTYPYSEYEGKIFVDSKMVQFKNPLDAEMSGIAIIHQELSSCSHLSVAENLFIGHWPKKAGLVDWEKLRSEARHWLDMVGLECDLDAPIGELSVGSQQMVEIAKALSRESRVLILDEPTSALTANEVERLFVLLKKLRSEGKALIYISHKMEEIYALSDRITVLRDGQTVHTALTKDLSQDALIAKMVGRSINRLFPNAPERILGKELIRVKDLRGVNLQGKTLFGPLSFTVREKEILGFAGLLGAGRTELLQGIFGDQNIKLSGSIYIDGVKKHFKNPRQAWRNKLSFIAEDRKQDSIFAKRSLHENVSLSRLSSGKLFAWIKEKKEASLTMNSLESLAVKTPGPEQNIENLSGGNQQKVVIARALQIGPKIVLMDEPTRGVDVGAKYEIYEILFRLATEGNAILLVSSDLMELMALADRMIVLNKGAFRGELSKIEYSQTEIMSRALS